MKQRTRTTYHSQLAVYMLSQDGDSYQHKPLTGLITMREEDLYELANEELNSRNRKADLWARACALATDDVDEARYLYTNLRVEELAIENNIDLTLANSALPLDLDPDSPRADAITLPKADEDSSDPTLALAPDNAQTLSQRIPDSDDESNLTPAQLALKRVSESMGDSTNQLSTNMKLHDEDTTTDSSGANAVSSEDDGIGLELSLDDAALGDPGSANSEPDTDKNDDKKPGQSAGLVLGDLTSDITTDGDNTIHIDADSTVDSVQAKGLRPEEVTLANSKAFFTDEDSGKDSDNTLGEIAAGSSDKPGTNPQAQGLSLTDPKDAANAADEAGKSQSFADDSLAAPMPLSSAPGSSKSGITSSSTDDPGSFSDKSGSDADVATNTPDDTPATAASVAGPTVPASIPEPSETISDSDFQRFSQTDTEETQQPARKNAGIGLQQARNDDDQAGELSDLIGSGSHPAAEATEVTQSADNTADTYTQAEDNEVEESYDDTVAAMQNAGPDLAREFAIYQNSSGIVSAIPKGGNLKAMLFTLPWLVSRRLWGHSIVYFLLLLVMLAAVLTMATLVWRQWPEVEMLDLGVAAGFAVLAAIGLFYLPYRFANSWQEKKLARKGFEYQSDQLATSIAGAEQSYLLGHRNRVEAVDLQQEYAEAA